MIFPCGLALKLGVPPTIVHPAPCCWSSLLLYAMLLGLLATVNSSSSVTVGGSLSLVAKATDHFRFFVLFPQASDPS